MATSPIKDELFELLKETREYARYCSELGIETVNPAQVTVEEITLSVTGSPAVKPAVSQSLETTASPASGHNAAAESDLLFEALEQPVASLPATSETLEDIWRDIGAGCTRCSLCAGRTQVVNTHGNRSARLMFVGEAPGADEDAQGKPFVGRAGQLLTKMIEAMGLKRDDVMIGNVNRCRPPANRQPTLEEAAICRPFLFREITVIQPQVIVVMGNTALRNLLEVKEGISRVRGRFQDFRGIKVMPTFHPAYLLRDPSKKRETWEDLKKVMEFLETHPQIVT
jgi:DNA polymerase